MKEDLRWIPNSLRQRDKSKDIDTHQEDIVAKKASQPNSESANKGSTSASGSPTRALVPLSLSRMNSQNGNKPKPSDHTSAMRTANGANGTIRSVPSESLQLNTRTSEEEPRRTTYKGDSPIPLSTSVPQLNGTRGPPPLSWQTSKQLGIGNGLARKISSDFGPTKMNAGGPQLAENAAPVRNGDRSSEDSTSAGGQCTCGHVCGAGNEGGKSTSSKFIERVMGERDAYKRELAAERLKFKEANDALDFAKAKMDKMMAERDAEMHDATVNKTLLKRKERQLEDMKGKIDIERQRADAALEQERVWKRDLDNLSQQSRQKVEDAEGYAAMMEAQNNTMVRHWKNKQVALDKQEDSMKKIHHEVRELLRKEAEKTKRLKEICDQYRTDNGRLTQINEALNQQHVDYKVETENSLRDLKLIGAKFDESAQAYLREATALRDKLKWSLNVSKDFRDLPSPVDHM